MDTLENIGLFDKDSINVVKEGSGFEFSEITTVFGRLC
jgi:hypothetical protein